MITGIQFSVSVGKKKQKKNALLIVIFQLKIDLNVAEIKKGFVKNSCDFTFYKTVTVLHDVIK